MAVVKAFMGPGRGLQARRHQVGARECCASAFAPILAVSQDLESPGLASQERQQPGVLLKGRNKGPRRKIRINQSSLVPHGRSKRPAYHMNGKQNVLTVGPSVMGSLWHVTEVSTLTGW